MERDPNISDIEQYVIDKVKQTREEAGMSQADLAAHLDVSYGFIGNIENPKRRDKYNLNHINKLAKIFKCSLCDFLPKKPL